MKVETAKKFLSRWLPSIQPKDLQETAKKVLVELDKSEEKILLLKKEMQFMRVYLPSEENILKASENILSCEIWKDIEGFEGKYQVSNKGRIKSLCFRTPRILRLCKDKTNYLRVALQGKNFIRNAAVHRLVAESFIPNPENKPIVNHIDGNKQNNCVENLEWATYQENSDHAWKTGLLKPRKGIHNPVSRFTAEEVKFIRENYKPHDKNFGSNALAKKFNVTRATIEHIAHGKSYQEIQ